MFQEGWLLCDVGEHERGLVLLRRAVAKGYFVAPTLSSRPQFDALRGDPVFQELVAEAEEGRREALEAFREAGGERLLGQANWEGRFRRLDALLSELKDGEG
jgi:hypothetical protein